jgi:hypothetical protein
MSRLENNSLIYRKEQIVKNAYNNGSEYNESNKNALSDGDEKGKGETNTVGGLTDIKTRNSLLVKNKYKTGNEYNESNA